MSSAGRVYSAKEIRVVIPSRKRVEQCAGTAKLFYDPILCIAESERDDYAGLGYDIVTHPDEVSGIAPLRQWILDHFDDEVLVQSDDDIRNLALMCPQATMGRHTVRTRNPHVVMQILANAATIASGIGAPIFGFAQTDGDIRKFDIHDPIAFATWVGGVIGFVGREARYDTSLKLRADLDACMRAMLHQRVIYCDSRFSFTQKKFGGDGGNAVNRSSERNESELARLKSRWGNWVSFSEGKGTIKSSVRVSRRQKV